RLPTACSGTPPRHSTRPPPRPATAPWAGRSVRRARSRGSGPLPHGFRRFRRLLGTLCERPWHGRRLCREPRRCPSRPAPPPPRHRHQEWLAFLRTIDRETPSDLDIHLIADNYATHKHAEVKRWLAKHPRFHMHFTPTSSSWLNLV